MKIYVGRKSKEREGTMKSIALSESTLQINAIPVYI